MISSEEFQQKLQSGQINAALALVAQDATLLERGFTTELDVTTRLTDHATVDRRCANNEYLRTKINLLTGAVQHEVGKDLVTDGSSYLKLQQLHIDQILTSHRIVQGHLHQLRAVLAALLPTVVQSRAIDPAVISGGLNADSLATRLAETRSGLTNNAGNLGQVIIAAERSDVTLQPSPSPMATITSDDGDDDLDLSIDEDGEIWEEWVENDDFLPESVIGQSTPSIPEFQLPDWQEHWVRKPLNPIDVKPIVPRFTRSLDPVDRWGKFAPEHIGSDIDVHSPLDDNNNSQHIDRLLADLDPTSSQLRASSEQH